MRRGSDDDENPFDGGMPGLAELLNGMTGENSDRVDTHEYDTHVTVVADIPGVSTDDIETRCDGRRVAIRADTDARPFFAQVDLPAYVDARSTESTVNNGILEITFTKDRDPADIGFQ